MQSLAHLTSALSATPLAKGGAEAILSAALGPATADSADAFAELLSQMQTVPAATPALAAGGVPAVAAKTVADATTQWPGAAAANSTASTNSTHLSGVELLADTANSSATGRQPAFQATTAPSTPADPAPTLTDPLPLDAQAVAQQPSAGAADDPMRPALAQSPLMPATAKPASAATKTAPGKPVATASTQAATETVRVAKAPVVVAEAAFDAPTASDAPTAPDAPTASAAPAPTDAAVSDETKIAPDKEASVRPDPAVAVAAQAPTSISHPTPDPLTPFAPVVVAQATTTNTGASAKAVGATASSTPFQSAEDFGRVSEQPANPKGEETVSASAPFTTSTGETAAAAAAVTRTTTANSGFQVQPAGAGSPLPATPAASSKTSTAVQSASAVAPTAASTTPSSAIVAAADPGPAVAEPVPVRPTAQPTAGAVIAPPSPQPTTLAVASPPAAAVAAPADRSAPRPAKGAVSPRTPASGSPITLSASTGRVVAPAAASDKAVAPTLAASDDRSGADLDKTGQASDPSVAPTITVQAAATPDPGLASALVGGGVATDAQAQAPASPAGTVANLSAQIVQQAGQRASRFDVQLTPDGLGRVDVAVQIDASGKVTAALSFERPEAAALVKDRSDDLQAALTSAGLTVAPGDLRIDHVQQSDVTATNVQAGGASTSDPNAGQGGQSGQSHQFAAGGQSFQQGQQNAQQERPGQLESFGRARSFEMAASAADVVDRQRAYGGGVATRGLDIRI